MTTAVLLQAFWLVFDPYVLLVILCSAMFGLFVGCIPGLSATMATALLVPITFFMPPVPAIAAIVTATAMAIFSGDIPGALLRIPGPPASAAYTHEAYPMTLKGQAGVVTAFENGVTVALTLAVSGVATFSAGATITGLIVATYADFTQGAAPANPSAGTTRLYAKTDGTLYYLNGVSGTEQPVGSNGYARAFLTMGG